MNNTSSTLATAEQQPLAAQPFADPYSVQQVLGQVALIQQIMAAAMKDGEHYGRIPGCGDKPTLLKPGAEKLCLHLPHGPHVRRGRAPARHAATASTASLRTVVDLTTQLRSARGRHLLDHGRRSTAIAACGGSRPTGPCPAATGTCGRKTPPKRRNSSVARASRSRRWMGRVG